MMKTILKITFFCILFTSGFNETRSQPLSANLEGENVNLYTDRTLYISGEKIQFAAYLFFKENNNLVNPTENSIDVIDEWVKSVKKQNKSASRIINVELITPDGVRLSEGKYVVDNSLSSGCVSIPNDIETGPYYLRAYTKFMRNNGPGAYSYISLKIVNPLKSNILKYNRINSTPVDSTISKELFGSQTINTITLDKKLYSTREQVVIKINRENLQGYLLRGLTLTVIPEYAYSENKSINPIVENYTSNQYYHPETKGISLTGELKDSKSDKKFPNTIINLSILGNSKDFMAVNTDSTGRFFFKIPEFRGVRNIFLCTEALVDSKATIFIDNDFCQSKIKIPTPTFQLNELEKKVAYNLTLNIQIASRFNKKDTSKVLGNSNTAFYGEPQMKLDLNNYIQLPTIEDYILELIPILKVKKHQGKKYFRIISEQQEMDIYKPLVLLDMVAIDNPEKILALSPQKISRFEIVNTPYIKGNITYGGIISIFSKQGLFADIDLPSSGVLLDYNFLTDCTYDEAIPTLTQPDTRSTLLWLPNIANNPKSKDFSFKTSDTPGKYIVLLRGVTNKGKEFIYRSSFEVKELLK